MLKAEYQGNEGFLQRDSVEHKGYRGHFRGILSIFHYAVGIERYADTPFPSGTAAQEFGASALYQGFDRAVFGIYGRRAVAFLGSLAHGYCGSDTFERRIIFTV